MRRSSSGTEKAAARFRTATRGIMIDVMRVLLTLHRHPRSRIDEFPHLGSIFLEVANAIVGHISNVAVDEDALEHDHVAPAEEGVQHLALVGVIKEKLRTFWQKRMSSRYC